jgi:hypothetical protein
MPGPQIADYYLKVDGSVEGPFTWDELCFLAGNGRFGPEDRVRDGKKGEWQHAREVPGLFASRHQIPRATPPAAGRLHRRPHNHDAREQPPSSAAPMGSRPADHTIDGGVADDRGRRRRRWAVCSGLAIAACLLILLLMWLFRPSGGGSGGSSSAPGSNSGLAGQNGGAETPTNRGQTASTQPALQKSVITKKTPATKTTQSAQTSSRANADRPSSQGSNGGQPGGSGEFAIGGGQFFGVRAEGKRFVYVVDCSGSMSGSRFTTVKKELLRSIHALLPKQEFYIVFFSDRAFPMFSPQKAEPATLAAEPLNLKRATRWTNDFPIGGGTEPTDAVKAGLKLRPDAIFLLTDGEFDSAVAQTIRLENNARVVIHTIGFKNSAGERILRQIAEQNSGRYRFVR